MRTLAVEAKGYLGRPGLYMGATGVSLVWWYFLFELVGVSPFWLLYSFAHRRLIAEFFGRNHGIRNCTATDKQEKPHDHAFASTASKPRSLNVQKDMHTGEV